MYYQGDLGVSANSQFDVTLVKLNINFTIEWYTSMDYNNLVEHASYVGILNQSIYVSFNSNDLYLWICKLSINDGSYQNSTVLQSMKSYRYDGFGRFGIIMVTPKYIFAYDYYPNYSSTNTLFIFDTYISNSN